MTSPIDRQSTSTSAGLPREQSRWLMSLARKPRAAMTIACGAPLVAGLLLIGQAALLAHVLSGVVGAAADERMPWLYWWRELAAMAALIAIRAALIGWGEHAGAAASERIKAGLRRALFDHFLSRGPAWSRARPSGELAAALLEHIDTLDGFFSKYLPALMAATLLPLAFAVAMLPVDAVAGFLLLLTAPLIPVFMALVGWGAQAAGRRHARAMSRLSGFFADRLRGAATLKMFQREQDEIRSVAAAAKGIRLRTMAVLRIAFLSSAVLEFFAALGVAGMAVYFGLSFLGFLTLPGDPPTLQIGLFCLLMAPEAYAPLRQFAAHYHDRATAQAAVVDIARLFGTLPQPDLRDTSHIESTSRSRARVHAHSVSPSTAIIALRLRDVSLAMGARTVHGISLEVRVGEHLALLGASGSGKTTLLETIARLRDDPVAGDIDLFGQPLASLHRAALCESIACMGQRPYLFEGTLADNIRLGSAHASDAAVRAAAERACVTAFTDQLPDGLNTVLGPRALGLSGGEAHRVALARLYLRDPALVLLDEPSAHLDAQTETRVMDALFDWAQGRTLIVATHSSAMAQRCHRRVQIDDQGISLWGQPS